MKTKTIIRSLTLTAMIIFTIQNVNALQLCVYLDGSSCGDGTDNCQGERSCVTVHTCDDVDVGNNTLDCCGDASECNVAVDLASGPVVRVVMGSRVAFFQKIVKPDPDKRGNNRQVEGNFIASVPIGSF